MDGYSSCIYTPKPLKVKKIGDENTPKFKLLFMLNFIALDYFQEGGVVYNKHRGAYEWVISNLYLNSV